MEFLGLPGSGKSTVAREAVSRLRAVGVTAHETYESWNSGRSARLADVAGSLLQASRWRPRLFVEGWRLAGPLAGGATADRARSALYWLSRCGHYERARRTPGLHLIDQGVLQAYWSLVFGGHEERLGAAWPRLEGSRAHADAVVIVSARPQTVLARLSARPGTTSRLERSLGDAAAALERAETALAWVVERLERDQHRQLLLEVDNDPSDGAATAAASVSERLLTHFGSHDGL